MKYGKLVDGKLEIAPYRIEVDGKTISNPSEATLKGLGYKEVIKVDCPAVTMAGVHYEHSYKETKTQIKDVWTKVENIDEAKQAKIAELKAKRDSVEVAPITTDKGTFDYDDKSKERIKLAIDQLDNYTSLDWTLSDNTCATVRKCDLSRVVSYIAYRTTKLHVIYAQLKAMVNNAKTIEEVANVPCEYPAELTDEEKADIAEKHRLSLTCPKRKFLLMLEDDFEIKTSTIEAIVEKSDERIKTEWKYSTELWRSNKLLNEMAPVVGLSAEIIDILFMYESGEMTKEDYEDFVNKKNKK